MAKAWAPRAYQRAGIKWLLSHPAAALLWDPGLGKTTTVLEAVRYVLQQGGKFLTLAPKRVCHEVWSESGEVGKWSNFAGLRVALLHGAHKQDAVESDADLYVCNFEGLPWLCADGRLRSLLKRGVDTLVVDELSRLKNSQGDRFALLRSWLGYFKRRWGLTGSPASNGLQDLFGQVFVLDRGKTFGPYFSQFANSYFTPSGFGGHGLTLQEDGEERIYEALRPLAHVCRAKDHLDLPPLVERDVYVQLPKEARRIYDELEEDLLSRVLDETIVAANAAVASGKCRQVASGGIYKDRLPEEVKRGKREVVHLHDAKTEALVELVNELQGSPLLVCFEFQHDLERIRAALGDVPSIDGTTSDKAASESIRAWNAGELPVLCGHPKSMGHGLNLQTGGSHVCFYTLPWGQEPYDQALRRVYRQGVKADRVVVHRLIAGGTVDLDVANALAAKTATQDALLEALKARARKRRIA